MVALLILVTVIVGIVVFFNALKHSYEQWYYGRLNRETFEAWRNERR